MKYFVLVLLLATIASAGFFNENGEQERAQRLENERLCKLFTQKAEAYKKNMRDDDLARTTLYSYQERAKRFCDRVKPAEVNSSK